MLNNGYLYAEGPERIFINISLGCTGNCSYCYLPKMGYSNKKIIATTKSAEDIIDMINKSNIGFNKDTLITLGCFSECFDSFNKEETIKLIKYFLNNGNQIQVSTKKEIFFEDIKDILPMIKYYGQFVVYVSSASISMHDLWEKDTDVPQLRFKNFLYNKYFPVILYLKPVLKNVTYKDISLYKKFINEYNIEFVVVGSIFTEEKTTETVHFSKDNKLFYNKTDDEDVIINELKPLCKVYRRSTEVANLLKK